MAFLARLADAAVTMRTAAQYLDRAIEFEALARTAPDEGLRKRYADIAACYRLLAKEREWLIGTGALGQETTDQADLTGPSLV